MTPPTGRGAVAAGHTETVRAAAEVLAEGGNAFDAALAGLCMACVAEPVLASLGGGGFLIARPAGGAPRLYDFFAQTPKARRSEGELDFHAVMADFGDARQEFHIGPGAIATPGVVAGLFRVHGDLGRMPLARLIEPASRAARDGLAMSSLQAFILSVVDPIYRTTPAACTLYESRSRRGRPLCEGEVLAAPDFAGTLEALVREGPDLFYRGDLARGLADLCRDGGGHLTMGDMAGYRVIVRQPLGVDYGDTRIYTNPPPSAGGVLIAFALHLLRGRGLGKMAFGSTDHLVTIARVMALTNRARAERAASQQSETALDLLDAGLLRRYGAEIAGHPGSDRGTTHISVIDGDGNAAALTVSNGEGCGHIIPGSGVMVNNMLGEEDINPHGFHCWPADRRMSSMMAPTLMLDRDGSETVIGSGGSNRIRTALLQVILNLTEFGCGVADAVERPRLHFEGDLLDVEAGFDAARLAELEQAFPRFKLWSGKNMYFGGVHGVHWNPAQGRLAAGGDPRRGGATKVLSRTL